MRVNAYLNFEGRCEEAINFYKSTLHAEVVGLMRYKDMPGCDSHPNMAAIGDRILHSCLRIGESDVMMSDGHNTGIGRFEGVQLTITVCSDAQAQKVFAALSEGGKVRQALQETFFSSQFGMLTDKFGVEWMVIVMPENAAEQTEGCAASV